MAGCWRWGVSRSSQPGDPDALADVLDTVADRRRRRCACDRSRVRYRDHAYVAAVMAPLAELEAATRRSAADARARHPRRARRGRCRRLARRTPDAASAGRDGDAGDGDHREHRRRSAARATCARRTGTPGDGLQRPARSADARPARAAAIHGRCVARASNAGVGRAHDRPGHAGARRAVIRRLSRDDGDRRRAGRAADASGGHDVPAVAGRSATAFPWLPNRSTSTTSSPSPRVRCRCWRGDRDVTVTAGGDTEVRFTGDNRLLRQMVTNLLDNAVRHAPRGGTVRASVQQTASHDHDSSRRRRPGVPGRRARPHLSAVRALESGLRRRGPRAADRAMDRRGARWLAGPGVHWSWWQHVYRHASPCRQPGGGRRQLGAEPRIGIHRSSRPATAEATKGSCLSSSMDGTLAKLLKKKGLYFYAAAHGWSQLRNRPVRRAIFSSI